jgi:4-hydroxy-3-polyprenylbenzoate decarboxylase
MRRLIVGISGASGAIYGIRILQVLRKHTDVESHLVLSQAARLTIAIETPYSAKEVVEMARVLHDNKDIGASISSGSFRTEGMVIAPCSMKTLGGIAHSVGEGLLTRAADVVLKERKKLVLLARETPLHLGHLENMLTVTRMGATIFPPVPAYYHRPKTLDDIVDQTVARVLDQFGIELDLFERWKTTEMEK